MPPDSPGERIAGCILGTAAGDSLGLPREGLSGARARRLVDRAPAIDAPVAERLAGCLLGTAAGDSVGLPRDWMPPARADRLYHPPPLRQGLLLGRGLLSDDTEQTALVAWALLSARESPEAFARAFARGLRSWFLSLPVGLGKATARACFKLCCGFGPAHSGVRSAGNGAAMRAALVGVVFDDRERRRAYVDALSRVTHTDPRAVDGARVVAHAAALAGRPELEPREVLGMLVADCDEPELRAALETAAEHLARGAEVAEVAAALGQSQGVSGYVVPTVALAIYAWLRCVDDFRAAVESVIVLGGDTDTTGAVCGALSGTRLGPSAIPAEWLDRLADWPRSVRYLRSLAGALAASLAGHQSRVRPLFWPVLLARNLVVLVLALGIGLRRLLPPY